MTHGSNLEQLEAAFGALGKRLIVGVEDIADPTRRRVARKARAPRRRPRRPSRASAR